MRWINEKENLDFLINQEHVSYEEIGRRYNCTGAAVKRAAERLGLNIPQRRKVNPNETFRRGAIPYYGTSLSNLASWKTALSSGFTPSWIEVESRKNIVDS